MDPFETPPATQSPVDPFATPPATPRPAADVADTADFVNASWSRRDARGARHWNAEGAAGGARVSAGGARWQRAVSGLARGARHWNAEGATCGARDSAGGARWQTVESRAKRGARDSARSEAIKYVTLLSSHAYQGYQASGGSLD